MGSGVSQKSGIVGSKTAMAAVTTPQRSGIGAVAAMPVTAPTHSGMAPPSRPPSAPRPSSRKELNDITWTRRFASTASVSIGMIVTQ